MKEIVVYKKLSELYVAVIENNLLVEYWAENLAFMGVAGSVFSGVVENVVPSIDACFVNIGFEKKGFLQSNAYKIGDTVLCQIDAEESETKGAKLTDKIKVAGKFLVLVTGETGINISKKIEDEKERARLMQVLSGKNEFGFIVRTNAEGVSEEVLLKEQQSLENKLQQIKARLLKWTAPSLLFDSGTLINRVMRDIMDKKVVCVHTNFTRFAEEFLEANPHVKIEEYDEPVDLFAKFKLDEQVAKLSSRKVALASGGSLVFDSTEALSVIDVNTAKFAGENNYENTVFTTNKMAADEIARQIKLRNIGGIILVDFISMDSEKNKKSLLEYFEKILKKDRQKTQLFGMTNLGLVELSRKKKRGRWDNKNVLTCPYCAGEGQILSTSVVASKIKEVLKKQVLKSKNAILLYAHPDVVDKLFELRYRAPVGFAELDSARIYIIPDKTLHHEKFTYQNTAGNVLDLPDNARLFF